VLNEFKKIQQQNLEDIRRMKQGKQPLSEKELHERMKKEQESKIIEDVIKKQENESKEKTDKIKDIVSNIIDG
jgi:hypothetical protein